LPKADSGKVVENAKPVETAKPAASAPVEPKKVETPVEKHPEAE
jgi:hypothetical protein